MITILCSRPRVLPEPQYIARMMTHIWVPSPNCALSWVLMHFRIRSRMFGQVRGFIVHVMLSCITVLQTALPRACNVGQARAPAVASTPARRFCATRQCTLCLLGHVARAVRSFSRKARYLMASRNGGVGSAIPCARENKSTINKVTCAMSR